jgi:hypothetical protein
MRDMSVDSKEGIAALMDWARAGGFVLDEYHERIARKHGVSILGVTIRHPLPVYDLPVHFPVR